MILEARSAFRRAVIKEIFGDDWKPGRPLDDIGGLLAPLLNGRSQNEADYQNRAGRITGLIEASKLLDNAIKDMNEPGTEERD